MIVIDHPNQKWNYNSTSVSDQKAIIEMTVWRYRWQQKNSKTGKYEEIDLAKQIYNFYINNGRTLSNSILNHLYKNICSCICRNSIGTDQIDIPINA